MIAARTRPTVCMASVAKSAPAKVAAPSKNVAAKIAAVAAAVLVSAAPVFAADDAVKNAVCARTPTAKMCLRDSAKR